MIPIKTTIPDLSKPKVTISHTAYKKIMGWVMACDIEVSGLGTLVKMPDGSYVVTDAYISEQTCSGTETELTAEGIAKLDEWHDTNVKQGNLRVWWHSHVNMGVFWSGTDLTAMASYSKGGFCIAIVFNKAGAYKTAYCQGHQDFPALMVDDLPTTIAYFDADEDAIRKKEIADHVSRRTYGYNSYNYLGAEAYGHKGNTNKGWWEKSEAWEAEKKAKGTTNFIPENLPTKNIVDNLTKDDTLAMTSFDYDEYDDEYDNMYMNHYYQNHYNKKKLGGKK
jgi:hypothetical protein